MARKTLRVLAGEAAARKLAQGANFSAILRADAFGKATDPKWKLIVALSAVSGGTDDFVVADDSGKERFFPTVDSALRVGAQIAEHPTGSYSVFVETGALFASKVPANIYTDAENKIVKLNRVNVVQTAKLNALSDLVAVGGPMHGWDIGNAAQQAKFAEVSAQIDAVNVDITAIGAEVTRLQAIVDSKP